MAVAATEITGHLISKLVSFYFRVNSGGRAYQTVPYSADASAAAFGFE